MVTGLMARITQRDETIASKNREITYRQTKIDQLTHEMAVLKRWKFGRSREQLDSAQVSLLDEAIDADIAAIELELEHLAPAPIIDAAPRQQPKRAALPLKLPRVEMHHPRLRLHLEAHRRRRQREAGLHARPVHSRAPYPRQMGLRQVPDIDSGTSARADHRQRHPDSRPAGPGVGSQVRGPFAAIPSGGHLRAGRLGHTPFNTRRLGGPVRRAVACCW